MYTVDCRFIFYIVGKFHIVENNIVVPFLGFFIIKYSVSIHIGRFCRNLLLFSLHLFIFLGSC